MSSYLENAKKRNLESEREFAEYALSKAHLLDDLDRRLIELRHDKGWTYEAIGAHFGMSKSGMTTRIHKIEDRMMSEPFRVVAMHGDIFPKKYRRFVRAKYLEGLNLRQISRKLKMPFHKAREANVATQAILEAMFNYSPDAASFALPSVKGAK